MTSAPTIRIVRGVPGLSTPDLPPDTRPYPDTAIDFAKVARAEGFVVEFQDPDRSDRTYLTHNAADIWLPALEIGANLLMGVTGGLFTNLIQRLIDRRRLNDSILHVEYRVIDNTGAVETLRMDGKSRDVLRALDEFEARQVERQRRRALEERSSDEQPDSDDS